MLSERAEEKRCWDFRLKLRIDDDGGGGGVRWPGGRCNAVARASPVGGSAGGGGVRGGAS
jgi:hypothetical protein